MTTEDLPYITVKIIGIEPGACYERRVYDQYVFLELPDGKIIDVFDDRMICKPDMLSSIKKVTILVALVIIEKMAEPIYDIIPAVYDRIRYSPRGNGHIFYGKIESKDEKYKDLIVNVGYGSVLSDTQGQFDDFQIGDFVKIYSVRADLDNIRD
jgi:hypothetical protein